jgi:hypothetical protein
MSASRDTEQKMKFVFSNFYHLYLQSKVSAQKKVDSDLAGGIVLRTGMNTETVPEPAQIQVLSQEGQGQLKKWVIGERSLGRKSLSVQVKTLRTAHKRLIYLIEEIDEILKRD